MIVDIRFKKSAEKEIKKLEKSNPKAADKIIYFIFSTLATSQNPATLPNAKALKGFPNHYRWRLGDYRIIGIIENGEFRVVEIVKIDKRDDNTYKQIK